MNENWKNEFGRRFSPLDDNMDTQKEVEDFIESLLQQQREEIKKEYIKEVLLDFHKNRLDGKGFDFFFRLSTDLDKLKNIYDIEKKKK